jgi:hypothetical protein
MKVLTPVCRRLKYRPNWPSRSRVAGNLKVNGSLVSFTQNSKLSPITLRGQGLLTKGILVRVCSLTAGAVTDCTYKDIHNGVFVVSGLDSRQGEDPASLFAVDMWMIHSKYRRYLNSNKNQSRNLYLPLPCLSSIYALAFLSVYHLRYAGTSPQHSFLFGTHQWSDHFDCLVLWITQLHPELAPAQNFMSQNLLSSAQQHWWASLASDDGMLTLPTAVLLNLSPALGMDGCMHDRWVTQSQFIMPIQTR